MIGLAFLLPLYWLALQPRAIDDVASQPQPDIMQRAVAALTNFAFLPLLALYAVILHVYGLKIAVDAALPRNQIGWFVSLFLALGYAGYVLSFSPTSLLPAPRRWFQLLWPPATLAPIVLLGLALRERIAAYGVTEDRAVIVAAAFAAALLLLVWLPRRRLDPRLVPLAFGALLVVVGIGPLSARLVSVHSQASRLVAILGASGELRDGRFDGERSTPWSTEARRALDSIIWLLERHRALGLLVPVMGDKAPERAQDVRERLALSLVAPTPPQVRRLVRVDADLVSDSFALGQHGRHVLFRAPGLPDLDLRTEGVRLVLTGPAGSYAFDLSGLPPQAGLSGATDSPSVVRADDPRAVLLVHEQRTSGTGDARRIDYLRGSMLLRGLFPSSD